MSLPASGVGGCKLLILHWLELVRLLLSPLRAEGCVSGTRTSVVARLRGWAPAVRAGDHVDTAFSRAASGSAVGA
jgi:hypothetical protein